MSHQVRFAWELPEALLAGITQGKGNIVEAVKHAAVLAGVRMKQVFGRRGRAARSDLSRGPCPDGSVEDSHPGL
jgi:hypothetical protein